MKLFSRNQADGPGRRRSRAGRLALSVGLMLPLAASLSAFASSAFNASPASASIPVFETGGSFYTPVVPTRIADTRPNSGYQGAGDTLTAGQILHVQVTGFPVSAALVPLGATAVVVNITAVNPTKAGYLTAYASGQPMPLASTVNFIAGQTIANEATITVGNTGLLNPGYIDIFNYTGSTDVVVDVQGYYSLGEPDSGTPGVPDNPFQSFYYPISYDNPTIGVLDNAPVRVLDTRPGSGEQGQGETIGPDAQITFFPGTASVNYLPTGSLVPENATAVVLNLTEADNTASSYLTAWATGFGQPLASDLNWQAGNGPVANRVIVPYNPVTQTVSIFNWAGSTDVVADLDGYFAPESEFGIVNPLLTDLEPTGCPVHDQQTLTISATATGSFTLTDLAGNTTPAITIGTGGVVTSAQVAAALAAIGYPDTGVTGGPNGPPSGGSDLVIDEAGYPLAFATGTGVTLESPLLAFSGVAPLVSASSCPGWIPGSAYYGLTAPNRIADTRAQTTIPYALSTLGALSILDVQDPGDIGGPVTGATVPSGIDGADINATVTDTTAASYLEIFPAQGGIGLTATQVTGNPASDINWTPGEIISNGDIVAYLADFPSTSMDLFNWAGTVDVVIDVYGYFVIDPIELV
jgi:hypothetical protein